MNKLHYLCVFLLVITSTLYASVLVYFIKDGFTGTTFIDAFGSAIYGIDPNVVSDVSSKATYLKPIGFSITEGRSIIGVMILSVILFLTVIALMLKERISKGYHTIQVPLISVSILLLITFVAQSFRLGVFL